MAYEGQKILNTITKQLIDSAATSYDKFVAMVDSGTADNVEIGADASKFPRGILAEPAETSTDRLTIEVDMNDMGKLKGVAGAAVTVGVRLMVTTGGKLIPYTSGTYSIGWARTAAAADGDYFLFEYDPVVV